MISISFCFFVDWTKVTSAAEGLSNCLSLFHWNYQYITYDTMRIQSLQHRQLVLKSYPQISEFQQWQIRNNSISMLRLLLSEVQAAKLFENCCFENLIKYDTVFKHFDTVGAIKYDTVFKHFDTVGAIEKFTSGKME